jgi:alpha-glucosidase
MRDISFGLFMILLQFLCSSKIDGQRFSPAGDYLKYRRNKNVIEFNCTGSVIRLEICSDDIVRIIMSPAGKFRPDEHYVVIKYDWPLNDFTVKDKGSYIAVKTGRMEIRALKSPFRFEFYDLDGRAVNRDWKEGSMYFRGDEVMCKKELTETDHFFGLGQRYEKSDLRGMRNTCLVTREYTPVPFFLATDGYGIFFHNTWASTFDFTQNPYTFSAPGGGELDYYFIYGPGFKHILKQYSSITGFSPLPPKWAFGLFFSRWDQPVDGWNYRQEGQDGMLRTIKAAREIWNWPLDGIRVHSKGPLQNFYASPNRSWPDLGWGAFPAVDTFVQKLHDMHIHPLFWEAPGVTGNCRMYDEALKNNYLLLKDGKPFNVVFGYLQAPGGMVDFMNPAARKWWGEYHYYMADFGSDGVAGDWADETLLRNTVSPSTGQSAEEFLNIYSLLFNQASWEAYREHKPDKRCINFGLVYWAGGQRYPMQGTQDSHAAGKNIFGEMMGCINLGLSGIPFRTFTDNVSRSILPGLPLSRLSQYLSLTVAGERTLCTITGDEMADWNYRHYGKLRYRLMPYIYTYAREATINGSPLIRALVLENQNDPKTYDSFYEYLLGKEILIAPLWSDTTFYREIYLPEGEWYDFFNDTMYNGKQTITFHAPIDKVPIFIKSGAIIPMAPDNQHYIDEIKSPMTIQIYPKGRSSFELYEDDGESYDYERGDFSITTFSCEEAGKELIIKKSAHYGKYSIPEKEIVYCIHLKTGAKEVLYNERSLPLCRSEEEFNSQNEGWMQESGGTKLLWFKVNLKAADKMEVKVSF